MFNNQRLSLARHRRCLTGKALADLTGLSAVTISRLEKGDNQPDDKTVEKLASILRFPSSFFFSNAPETLSTEAVSFRSLTKISAKERDAAISAGILGLELNDWIEERFALPEPNLIDLGYETDIEAAARSLRQYWALGEKSIGNVIGLLETNGVRVFSLTENTASVDAFSFWRNDVPFIFLNTYKTAERSIFDCAHEVGHLVLHRHCGPRSSRSTEREADKFASSFFDAGRRC